MEQTERKKEMVILKSKAKEADGEIKYILTRQCVLKHFLMAGMTWIATISILHNKERNQRKEMKRDKEVELLGLDHRKGLEEQSNHRME